MGLVNVRKSSDSSDCKYSLHFEDKRLRSSKDPAAKYSTMKHDATSLERGRKRKKEEERGRKRKKEEERGRKRKKEERGGGLGTRLECDLLYVECLFRGVRG